MDSSFDKEVHQEKCQGLPPERWETLKGTISRDMAELYPETSQSVPDRIRTCDLWYRKPVLYPLSYGDIAVIPQRG